MVYHSNFSFTSEFADLTAIRQGRRREPQRAAEEALLLPPCEKVGIGV
jgi:hypothetical protein